MKIQKSELNSSAFSLIEISISLIIIFCIMGATVPLISKRIKSGNHKTKKFGTTKCNSITSDGFCKFCDPEKNICVICTRLCEDNQTLNVEECSCN